MVRNTRATKLVRTLWMTLLMIFLYAPIVVMIALSFNAQNLKLERLRARMAQAGLEVLQGGAYDGFAHWVEQAITRDIAICRKPM